MHGFHSQPIAAHRALRIPTATGPNVLHDGAAGRYAVDRGICQARTRRATA